MFTLEEAYTALDILKRAHNNIAIGEDHYICIAISESARAVGFGYMGYIATALREAVMNSLGKAETFDDWLIQAGFGSANSKVARLEYLRLWIEQFERDIARKEQEEI